MAHSLRTIGRVCIVFFVLWHIAAVGLYAIPDPAMDKVSQWLKKTVRPYAVPYMLSLSQWQQWNLFSPDPLRRVTEYRIEAMWNGEWQPVRTLTMETLGPRAQTEMTILRKLEEAGVPSHPVLSRYLGSFCQPLGLPRGTVLRMMFRSEVLPMTRRDAWWRTWDPQWWEAQGARFLCGSDAVTPIDPL